MIFFLDSKTLYAIHPSAGVHAVGGLVARRLKLTKFKDLDIEDHFFDSLKQGYSEFTDWFDKKSEEAVYAVVDDTTAALSGMLYLKREDGSVDDVIPPLPERKWLKVGTLKIDGKGTKLGERVIKKIFDTAISLGTDGIYVTVFELHQQLIDLFKRYGFEEKGTKTTQNGTELVLVRSLTDFNGDRLKDYPFVHLTGQKAWLLAIYPAFHTELLPDSILRGEAEDIVQDVSHTNTIHKVYISKISTKRMSPGDIIVFYRTNDGKGKAYYRSVVTSVCVIEEVRAKNEFANVEAFLEYAKPRSVFPEDVLRDYWATWKRLYVTKMTYNVALSKRTTRGQLLDQGIVSEHPRWDIRSLSAQQLSKIVKFGEVDSRLFVD